MSAPRLDQRLRSVRSARAKVLFYALFAIGGFLIWRLYDVQVRQGPWLARKAHEQQVGSVDVFARRGGIFDRDGNAIAVSMPSQSIYATPREIRKGEAPRVAAALAPILGVDRADLQTRLESRAENVLLARKLPKPRADQIDALDLEGIHVEKEPTGVRRVASGRFASTIVGFTDVDEHGLEGLEYQYDALLRGSSGRMQLEEDQFGRSLPFADPRVVEQAKPGYGIDLTIDSYLQFAAQRELNATVAKWGARSGTIVIMDPNTGELLAIANNPDYDVRNYASASPDARRNRAIADAYEPGSTFKLITAAAALESGKVRAGSMFPARDSLTVGEHTIHNAEDGFMAGTGGMESLEDIIAYSHNVGAAEVGMSIGQQAMYSTIRAFGFGDETQAGMPGENPGIVPAPADWSATTLPTISFGHGIATTPIAMARAYAAIANGGLLLRPRILSAVVDENGTPVYRYGTQVEHRVMSPQTAATLRRFLRAVVVRGTGNPTAKVPGYTTAGKTGTAQVARGGAYAAGEYIASFIGFIPAEAPRFLILVKIEAPRGAIYGSVVAAPAFADLARIAMLHAGQMPAAPLRLVKEGTASKQAL
jgi:cell division protein FtsI (penicillin-binding protein 3)